MEYEQGYIFITLQKASQHKQIKVLFLFLEYNLNIEPWVICKAVTCMWYPSCIAYLPEFDVGRVSSMSQSHPDCEAF